MSDFSDYVEQNLRDWMSQGSNMPSAPGNIHVALHTGSPGDDGASNEVSAGDYGRVSTTAGTDWDTPANNEFDNTSKVDFGTATSDWGDVSHVSLWDSSTGGNCLAVGSLNATETVSNGTPVNFPAGELTFTID